MKPAERCGRVAMTYGRADGESGCRLPDLIEPDNAGHVDEGCEVPVLLRYPKPDIGRAGDQHGIWVFAVDLGELVNAARRKPFLATVRDAEHLAVIERGKPPRRCRLRPGCWTRRGRGIEACVYDRPVAGAAAEITGEPVLDAPPIFQRALKPSGIKLHHEARRAKAALRAVMVNQCLRHPMERPVGTFH